MAQVMTFPQGGSNPGGALAGGGQAAGPAPMQPAPMQAAPPPGPGGALAGGGPPQGQHPMQMMADQVEGGAGQLQMMLQEAVGAVQSGQATMGDIQQLGNMATTAMSDPRLYGTVVELARRVGLGGAMPPEPDPSALGRIALVAHRLSQMAGGQKQPPSQRAAPQLPSMKGGGYIHPDAPSKGVNVVLHPGEVVMREDVVRDKGLDFFRKLHEPKRGAAGR